MERVKKLSIAYCKKILESSGKKYSDEEQKKSEIYFTNLMNWITAFQWI
jgi:hypothetical protein